MIDKIEIKRWDTGEIIYTGPSVSDAVNEGVSLYRADLRGADLRGADLSGADLSGAGLSGADLSGADLSGADLSGANLSGADLRGANLAKTGLIVFQAAEWVAIISPDDVQIGCQRKDHDWWLKATYEQLGRLDPDAPEAMKIYKPVLEAAMLVCKEQGWPKKKVA